MRVSLACESQTDPRCRGVIYLVSVNSERLAQELAEVALVVNDENAGLCHGPIHSEKTLYTVSLACMEPG
jgi:hypothetical protein